MENLKNEKISANTSMSTNTTRKKQKSTMREKRNKQYEDMAKECAGLNISDIRVEDFVEARKKELNKFIHILNNKYSSKVGFQLLPKHMRRRQMSHNPFRIPIRARLSNLNVNVKSKCKKHKKKRIQLKRSLLRRAANKNWLETHLWHAKRFKMGSLFGHTIAINRRDKGFKACYRYGKYDSCIYDSSYYAYIVIREKDMIDSNDNNNQSLLDNVFQEIINNLTCDKVGYSLDNKNQPEYHRAYNINLYHSETGRLIGPVCLILFKTNIILQFHPLMQEEIIKTFYQISKKFNNFSFSFNNTLNNFTLLGPRTGSTLYKIVKSLRFENDEKMGDLFSLQEEEFEKELHFMKEGQIILFRMKKPISHFKMNEMSFNKLTNRILNESENSNSNLDNMIVEKNITSSEFIKHIKSLNNFINNNALDHFNQTSQDIDENFISSLESNSINKKVEIEIPTERTVFQHRKNVKLDVLNKKLQKSIKSYNKNKVLFMQNKKNENEKEKEEIITSESNNKNIPKNTSSIDTAHRSKSLQDCTSVNEDTYFILVKFNIEKYENNQTVLYPVYNLISAQGFGVQLLRRFVYLESRPLGLNEFKYYFHDSNKLMFPDEYPSTNSYLKFIKEKCFSELDKYCRYPASKRVNYQKTGNPFPFYAAWHKLKNAENNQNKSSLTNFNSNTEIVSDLSNKNKITNQFKIQKILNPSSKSFVIPVYIEMTSKGIPLYNSLICLPTKDDLINYRETISAKINKNNFAAKILSEIENFPELSKVYQNRNDKIIEPKRPTHVKNKILNLEYKTIKEGLYPKNHNNQINQEFNYDSDILNYDLTIKTGTTHTIRKIIGFVTSGGFSYLNTKGIGKGYLHLDHYEELIKLKNESKLNQNLNGSDLFVLVRSRNSRIYYLAKIKILSI